MKREIGIDVPIDLSPKTALLEIDFQPWVIELGHDPDVIERAVFIRDEFRSRGALVVCTRYLSLDARDAMRSDPSTEGARFHPSLSPQPGDLVATKHDRDIWTNPDLDLQLRLNGITHIVVIGLVTDFGVDLAARGAKRLGYDVTVRSDGCAGTSVEAHRATLESLVDDGIDVDSGMPGRP
ncbi:cysteine hydrolase family protein [Rhodococcus sp. P1Y]|uniref:cysteine hydrolase family protein n=1 Tax=Rhodococcus sp. P1Y TaxID=1302308 RepID=UPI000EB330F9|nr:cysteine hydrolase [Rhodococcus sp. P1Y]AYJ47703.1 cysteine hydrolase [Rhodococcus sp. P1Y]